MTRRTFVTTTDVKDLASQTLTLGQQFVLVRRLSSLLGTDSWLDLFEGLNFKSHLFVGSFCDHAEPSKTDGISSSYFSQDSGFHACRTFGGHRHYWNISGTFAASDTSGTRGGSAYAVHEPAQANRPVDAKPCLRAKLLSNRRQHT